MSKLTITGGQLELINGGRKVISTDGLLVNLLPPANDYNGTVNVVFPDFTKDYAYNWWWLTDGPVQSKYRHDNGCQTQVTVPKQDWSQTTILGVAPAGADIFVGMVRINRTAAPSHSWGGSPITPLPPANVWLPFTGSVLMEAEIGMARAFSLYLSGGNLVLHRQQSVAVPPGGYGTYGGTPFGTGSGGEWVYGSRQGIPVVPISTRNSDPTIEENAGIPKSTHRRGGSAACGTSLSTNFSSTYRVEITGQFGRRS